MSLKVGIVGCGLMGTRRAASAVAAGDRIVLVADLERERAQGLADRHGASVAASWEELVGSSEVEAVVVATHNTALAEVAEGALESQKHVFCEKPFGTTAEEAGLLLSAAREAGTVVSVGFTLRHHQAIRRAHDLVQIGAIGRLVCLRGAYGHGGRPGYETEWRGNPTLSGGGEQLDQGVHLLDLSRWFLGDFAEVSGAVATWAWPVEPLEDNGFALLRTHDSRVASLHTSWSQWRNLFRLELLGTDGMLRVEGLGGSYGPERLSHARRRPEGGAPDQWEWTIPDPEQAWASEWADFGSAVRDGQRPLAGAEDGYEAARLVDAVYAAARESRTVQLSQVAVS